VIIQCKKCGTKYRFDKMKVTGKGVWVRCRNCETVFFQKNPLSEISSLMDLVDPERKIQEETQEERAKERDGVVGEAEASDTGEEPTWEDAYQDAGEGIEIKGAEEEDGSTVGEAEAGDTGEEPTWEDAYQDAGDGIEIERVEEEDQVAEKVEAEDAGGGIEMEGVQEEDSAVGEPEASDADEEPTGEGVPLDTGESMEMEGAEEEEDGTVEKTEAEGAVAGIEIERAEDEEDRIAGGGDAGDADQGPKWEGEETFGDAGEATDGEDGGGRQRVREPWAFGDSDEVIYNEKITGKKRLRQLLTLGTKIVLYLVLVALLSGGVYLWLVPEARETVSNRVFPWVEKTLGIEDSGGIEGVKEAVLPKVEKMLGIKGKDTPDEGAPELRVTLINVGERFVKGWTAENIMVVEGSAVNTNELAVSNIGIRGKVLDSSGKVLSEEESNCGTILTDDELKNLTRDEIKKELSNPYGRDFRNADIQPGDGIPFMLVFTIPVEEATELVVELIGIEAAKGK